MSWPLASHFSAMLQKPAVAFRDPELKSCQIAKDARNQPRPWAGAFAVVYKATVDNGGRAMAVRVFTTESPERRERYDRISEYLKTRRLKCLVDFEYRDASIRSAGDGKWYPLIVMDWVEGDTLFTWVRERSLAGDGKSLATAAERWASLIRELSDAEIAHGDLQHANVMVARSGELKLVDYDGMCVPSLAGRRNLEVGVEPYQHPGRDEMTHLGRDLDNFSALVIYVALRALAADPSLWRKHVEEAAYDKLLFRREDFTASDSSRLYRDLTSSPDRELHDLVERLFAAWNAGLDQVPTLAQLVNSYAKVESLLMAGQWDAAVHLLNRRGKIRDAPPHLKPLIQEAYENVCRRRSWADFEKIPTDDAEDNDRRLVVAWNDSLFRGFQPAERMRARVEVARQRVKILDGLSGLVEKAAEDVNFAREWSIAAAARPLPAGYRYGLSSRVDVAARRVAAIEAIERAIRNGQDDEQIVAAWQQVKDRRCEHLVDGAHRPRIELAETRLPVLRALRQIDENLPPEKLDRQLLRIWQEGLADGSPEMEHWQGRYEVAVRRRDLLRQMEQAVFQHDEEAIAVLLADPALAEYPLPASWEQVVRVARERATKSEFLIAALETGDRSAFLTAFDARLIRRYRARFHPYETVLSEWTETEVLPADRLGLLLALGRASLVRMDDAGSMFRVRWTWPQQRFTDECVVAICAEVPGLHQDPRNVEAQYRVPVDRESWEAGGGSRLIHVRPEWLASYVVVWASVDLGFRLRFSQPLVLGRLDETAAKGGGMRRFGRNERRAGGRG